MNKRQKKKQDAMYFKKAQKNIRKHGIYFVDLDGMLPYFIFRKSKED